MPSLMRLITFLAIMASLGYAALFALATFVEPQQSEMTIRIPADKLNAKPVSTGG